MRRRRYIGCRTTRANSKPDNQMARFLRIPFLLVFVLATACMEDSPFVPNIEETNFDPSLNVDLEASTKTASGLYYRDIIVGGGAQVPATGTAAVTTTYELYLRNGDLVQSGTFPFTVGAAGTIPGYDEGVRGMRVGGQRQLIIPPSLGYGEDAYAGIPGNSILVYFVVLTAID